MPIYFRYVAGNIIDVSTLITTVNELEQYGVSVSHAILDAGYFSEKNVACQGAERAGIRRTAAYMLYSDGHPAETATGIA